MTKNPNDWLRNRRRDKEDSDKHEPLTEEQLDALENFVINYRDRPRSAYDKLGSLRKIMLRCVPEESKLYEPDKMLINELPQRITEETNTPDTERSWRRDLRAFLRDYKEGEYSDLRWIFQVTPQQGKTQKVEGWMIYPLQTWREIAQNSTYSRTSAFISLLYNTAATPGELLQCRVSDIDVRNEKIKIRGNKDHRNGTYKIRPFALNHLKDYLRTHPSVENLDDTNYEKPLWIKYQRNHCRKCGKLPRNCRDGDQCEKFVPEEVEELQYSGFYKQWRKSVDRADIEVHHSEHGIKPKYARKSSLTEVVRRDINQRLEDFARWKPGSDQKKHYVKLAEEDIVDWMEKTFGRDMHKENEREEQICEVCGVWNPKEANMCRNCQRFLSDSSRQEVQEASTLITDIADYPLENVKIAAGKEVGESSKGGEKEELKREIISELKDELS